jgi:hypothetical protein
LGFGLAKTIEVWPAGLDALAWDGEGHAEWFASERPCVAIRVDHYLNELFAALNDHRLKVDLSAAETGAPIFVQLPQLAVGHHTIRLSARATPSSETEPLGELEIVIRPREIPAWLGVSSHGPLRVDIDPPTPSLEAFWEGRVDVSVRGPEGRAVKCFFTLKDKAVGSPKPIPPIALPITPDRWRQHFETHVRRSESASRAYDTADTCVIRFDGDELGAFEISCERTFTPLRWVVEGSGQRRFVRVIDDSGEPGPLQVVHSAFETPTVEAVLGDAPRHEVPSGGGMYIARRASESAAVIVSPIVQGKGFDALHCSPRIELCGRSAKDIVALARINGTWARARIPGNLIGMAWRRDVLRALTREIFRIIGGDAWTRAELATSDAFDELKRSVSRKQEERNIAAGLFRVREELAQKSCEQRVQRLAESITTFRLLPHVAGAALVTAGGAVLRGRPPNDQDAHWLAGLALRLASAPASVEEWAGTGLDSGLTKLMEIPTIARAARFLVLVIDRDSNTLATLEAPYAGWEWK